MFSRIIEFLGSRSNRSAQVRKVSGFAFVGEQDGPVERELKAQWAPILREFGVTKAYLVRVQFPDAPGPTVALAMTPGNRANQEIVTALVPPFKATMAGREFVDMLFLTPTEEPDVSRVCRSFLDAN